MALALTGGLLVSSALAGSPWFGHANAWSWGGPWSGGSGGPWFGGHAFGPGFDLPPELSGLRNVPPAGIASRALIAKLRIASSIWLASTNAGANPGSAAISTRTADPTV